MKANPVNKGTKLVKLGAKGPGNKLSGKQGTTKLSPTSKRSNGSSLKTLKGKTDPRMKSRKGIC